jgi:GMP synthase (glutamine-hydrolysing)
LAKILVFQHVPFEPLGTLDPLVRSRRHRIRYVNFHRDPEALPDINGYDALIILGGPMNIGEELSHPHLEIEKQVIREAASQDKPILGICLGAQLIASALGSHDILREKKK